MNAEELIALEQLVDKHGLMAALNALSSICEEKAVHIEASYGDQALARRWRMAGHSVDRAGSSVVVTSLPR